MNAVGIYMIWPSSFLFLACLLQSFVCLLPLFKIVSITIVTYTAPSANEQHLVALCRYQSTFIHLPLTCSRCPTMFLSLFLNSRQNFLLASQFEKFLSRFGLLRVLQNWMIADINVVCCTTAVRTFLLSHLIPFPKKVLLPLCILKWQVSSLHKAAFSYFLTCISEIEVKINSMMFVDHGEYALWCEKHFEWQTSSSLVFQVKRIIFYVKEECTFIGLGIGTSV